LLLAMIHARRLIKSISRNLLGLVAALNYHPGQPFQPERDWMNKCTVIATCLVNSRMFDKVETAENAVKRIFQAEFPRADFGKWNTQVNDKDA
jgi:hypothetical protein